LLLGEPEPSPLEVGGYAFRTAPRANRNPPIKNAPPISKVFLLKICTPPTRNRIVEPNLIQVKTPLAKRDEF
jgi:hypothetical protein